MRCGPRTGRVTVRDELDPVLLSGMELTGVLDGDQPFLLSHAGDHGAGQRRLGARRAARNQNVQPVANRLAECSLCITGIDRSRHRRALPPQTLAQGHRLAVEEGKVTDGAMVGPVFPKGEGGPCLDRRWQDGLRAQLGPVPVGSGGDDGMVLGHLQTGRARDLAGEPVRLDGAGRRHPLEVFHAFALDPDLTIRVDRDLRDRRIVQPFREGAEISVEISPARGHDLMCAE